MAVGWFGTSNLTAQFIVVVAVNLPGLRL